MISVILFFTIIIAMPVITFLTVLNREKKLSKKPLPDRELINLYEYKYLLFNAHQIKITLHAKLAAVNYNNVRHETFFKPFEIIVLKKELSNQIEELEDLVIQQNISVDDFNSKINQLNKRIDLLCLPIATLYHNRGNDYFEKGIVA